MDVTTAHALMVSAGYDIEFGGVELIQSIGIEELKEEPCYFFVAFDPDRTPSVAVGAQTGKVTRLDPDDLEIWVSGKI
jgi:hypothetical protein